MFSCQACAGGLSAHTCPERMQRQQQLRALQRQVQQTRSCQVCAGGLGDHTCSAGMPQQQQLQAQQLQVQQTRPQLSLTPPPSPLSWLLQPPPEVPPFQPPLPWITQPPKAPSPNPVLYASSSSGANDCLACGLGILDISSHNLDCHCRVTVGSTAGSSRSTVPVAAPPCLACSHEARGFASSASHAPSCPFSQTRSPLETRNELPTFPPAVASSFQSCLACELGMFDDKDVASHNPDCEWSLGKNPAPPASSRCVRCKGLFFSSIPNMSIECEKCRSQQQSMTPYSGISYLAPTLPVVSTPAALSSPTTVSAARVPIVPIPTATQASSSLTTVSAARASIVPSQAAAPVTVGAQNTSNKRECCICHKPLGPGLGKTYWIPPRLRRDAQRRIYDTNIPRKPYCNAHKKGLERRAGNSAITIERITEYVCETEEDSARRLSEPRPTPSMRRALRCQKCRRLLKKGRCPKGCNVTESVSSPGDNQAPVCSTCGSLLTMAAGALGTVYVCYNCHPVVQ